MCEHKTRLEYNRHSISNLGGNTHRLGYGLYGVQKRHDKGHHDRQMIRNGVNRVDED